MSYVRSPRLYLISHGLQTKFITDFLNTRPEILNWYSFFGGSIFIVSRAELADLINIIHGADPEFRFVISEVAGGQAGGSINQEVWDFVNTPKSSGRWE